MAMGVAQASPTVVASAPCASAPQQCAPLSAAVTTAGGTGTPMGTSSSTASGPKRSPSLPVPMSPSAPSKHIEVRNIPLDLDWRDIKVAFEAEAGKIDRFRLKGGTAWITFKCPEDARKVVETFDRGELNGKMIEVAYRQDVDHASRGK
eukprot:14828534-Alexandrium_andersonii.AAC.1